MAKSAPSAGAEPASNKPRWRVSVKGYPVMGFADHDGTISETRPVAVHYRRRAEDVDSGVPDGWLTERQLREVLGLTEIPANYRRRSRVRTDVTAALFEGAVVEAENEFEARGRFQKAYGLNDTPAKNMRVARADGEKLGPYGPKKLRGLLKQTA